MRLAVKRTGTERHGVTSERQGPVMQVREIASPGVGTPRELGAHMRAGLRLSPVVVCLACAGSTQPTTMRLLESLPVDRERAHEQMDSAVARPDAETRRTLPPKMRKVETAAATAAALIGSIFSTSANAIVGVGVPMEETELVPGTRATLPREPPQDAAPVYHDANELVPWLRLTPPPPTAR